MLSKIYIFFLNFLKIIKKQKQLKHHVSSLVKLLKINFKEQFNEFQK